MKTRSGSTTIVTTQVGTTAHEVNTLNSNWDTPCHSFLDIIQEIGEFCQPSYNRWVRVSPDTNTGRLILFLHLLDHAVQVMARTPRLDSPIFILTLRDSIHPTDTFVRFLENRRGSTSRDEILENITFQHPKGSLIIPHRVIMRRYLQPWRSLFLEPAGQPDEFSNIGIEPNVCVRRSLNRHTCLRGPNARWKA